MPDVDADEAALQEEHRLELARRARAGLEDGLAYEEEEILRDLDPKHHGENRRSLRRRGEFYPPRAGQPWEP